MKIKIRVLLNWFFCKLAEGNNRSLDELCAFEKKYSMQVRC